MNIMILNWIFHFLLFWHFSRQIQGEVTTNISVPCNKDTDCVSFSERATCKEKFCHCTDPLYVARNDGCDGATEEQQEYLKIPASESDSFFDLIQMRGLECGEKSTGRYRLSYIDGVPDNCVTGVNIFNGFFKFSKRILYGECVPGYIYHWSTATTCTVSKNPFKIILLNDDGQVAEINITTTNNESTFCYPDEDSSLCIPIDEIKAYVSIKIHPDCISKPMLKAAECPTDVSRPVVQVTPSIQDVQIHGYASITCRFLSLTNITNVEWLKGDFPVNNNMVETKITDNMSTLTIDNIGPVDEGDYQCVVSNTNGNASDTVNITLKRELPVVQSWIMYNRSEFKFNLSANDSERIELVCNVTAFPPESRIFWIKDKNGMSYKIDVPLSSPNLIFNILDLKHEGRYRCWAENEMGTNESNTLTLEVITTETMCPCSCGFKAKLKKWRLKNLSKEEFLKEMEPLMKEVLDNMKMDKSQISAVIRKLTSAPDDRKSSKQIGSFGIVIIVGAFAVIIIFDILSCIRFRPRRRD